MTTDLIAGVVPVAIDVITAYVDGATAEGYAEDWDLDELWGALRSLYPIQLSPREVLGENEFGERDDMAADELREAGVRMLYEQPKRGTAGSRVNFAHPKDCGGVLIELVEPGDEH